MYRTSGTGDTEESATAVLNLVGTSTEETLFTGLGAGRIQTHGSICKDTKPACRRARLSLWFHRSGALMRPQTAFRSLNTSSGPRFNRLLRSDGGLMYNASLLLCAGSGSPLKKAVFKSPLSNKCPSLTIHCTTADQTLGAEMIWAVLSNAGPEIQVRTIELWDVPTFFHVSTQRARRMWLRGTFNRSFTFSTASLSNHEAHSFCFAAVKASRSSGGQVSR